MGFKIGWRRVMEDRRMKKEGRRKAYYPVWQALGGPSFVDVRPRR